MEQAAQTGGVLVWSETSAAWRCVARLLAWWCVVGAA